ncbi:MAG: HAMP domain-containing histidine kinase [Cyanothece sp. SIO1E1]|nr:HAMP domain-containing histidine kinase [Cyanothece sp. SIO1E1]
MGRLGIGLFGEARTRILLLYGALMLGALGLSIPIFRTLLFGEVNARVEADLTEEIEDFQELYSNWETSPNPTLEDLTALTENFVAEYIPEDDNFFIFILDGEIQRTNPPALPPAIGADSPVLADWLQAADEVFNSQPSGDPTVGDILYVVQPLQVDGIQRAQFVIAHLSAGERQETLASVYVFGKVTVGLMALAFLLAWLGTGRLLRPVKELAVATRRVSETDLAQRLEVQGTGELADLGTTFNAMMDRLQIAFNSQRNFISDAGHELRTPITIIQGHLELMGDDPKEQAETLDIVMNELDRMGRLVNDLMLLMKAERTDFLQPETINIAAFTQALYDKARTLAERHWRLQIEATEQMLADHQRLTGALLNLLNNAAQQTTTSDSITLGCHTSGDQVAFWVQDTGEGIPEQEQARIFERFARVQHTHRRSEGSGLGLAIVQAIAEAHGGRIALESQPGQGATFTLVLPREMSRVPQTAASLPKKREAAGV